MYESGEGSGPAVWLKDEDQSGDVQNGCVWSGPTYV